MFFNTVCSFFRALRAAQILKNHMLVIFEEPAGIKHSRICMVLSRMSMLEVLVLRKYAECTSWRVKRTSGARVMIFVLNELELSLTDV